MSETKIEVHPFTPFLPEGAKIVICGTFPPTRDKWSMDFFYPNFYNDMWRVFGIIFFNDKDRFFNYTDKTVDKEGIMQMLSTHRIGIGETSTEVIRRKGNASDKFLEIVKPVDLGAMLSKVPACKAIITTGEKAASIIAELTGSPLPKMGESVECEARLPDGSSRRFTHWRMPSTSRAYPMKLENKTAYYREMLEKTGVIGREGE